MRTLTCIFFLLILHVISVSAQVSDSFYKSLPDSVKPKNKMVVTDKEKIRIILGVSQGEVQKNYNEIQSWLPSLETSMSDTQPPEERIPYAEAIAGFYIQTGNLSAATVWYKRIIMLSKGETAYRPTVTNACLNLSIFYSIQDEQDSAVDLLHHALSIAIADNDSAAQRDAYYLYMAIYANLGLYHQAIDYANRYLFSLALKDRWNDTYTSTMMAKAGSYIQLFATENKEQYADSANALLLNVMKAKEAEAGVWYRSCYSQLAAIKYYHKDYVNAVRLYDSALAPHYNQAGAGLLELRYRDIMFRYICLISLGHGEVIKAALDENIPANEYNIKSALNKALYQYYVDRNDEKNALKHYILFKTYSDSLDLIGQRGKVFEANQKYSVAQKEIAIAKLQNENLKSQAGRNRIVIAGTLLLLLMVTILFVFYIRNKKQQLQIKEERQRLAEELHKMANELETRTVKQKVEKEQAIKEQRQTISKDMHDEISSGVALLPWLIADVKKNTQDAAIKKMLEGVEEEAKSVYLNVRDFMHRLHNDKKVQQFNVCDLLENLTIRFDEKSALNITAFYDSQEIQSSLSASQQTEMYLVIKEAVANSIKHSGASAITIKLHKEEERFLFEIADNGKGLKNGPVLNGLGIESIKQRIEFLHGNIHLESSTQGTTIAGNFPVNS